MKTDSKRLACEKAPAVWNEQVAAWKAQLSGHDDDGVKHFEAVQDLASAKGVRYMPLDQVVQLPINTLLERIETIANRDQRPDPVEAAAILGTKQPPALTVTQALETYWALAKDKHVAKARIRSGAGRTRARRLSGIL